MSTINIFNYIDAAKYLRDTLALKGNHLGYSFRSLAKRFKCVSHSRLYQMVQGKAKIPLYLIDLLDQHVLKHNEAEQRFFAELVKINHMKIDKIEDDCIKEALERLKDHSMRISISLSTTQNNYFAAALTLELAIKILHLRKEKTIDESVSLLSQSGINKRFVLIALNILEAQALIKIENSQIIWQNFSLNGYNYEVLLKTIEAVCLRIYGELEKIP